ncbi:MAG: flagellar filament protein FlaA [Treponema sp.]|nr:flagellar filament protein FlaA [Treponema sp.]
MKKGLFVLASLSLLLAFGSAAFAQPNTKSVVTITIDNFDKIGSQDLPMWEHGKWVRTSWDWAVQASRFVAEGYPIKQTFEAIPNSLRVLRTDEATPTVLGLKTKFNRKGDNWFELYPTKDDKPFEIPLEGTVTHFDFWVWGAHYLYFLDMLVRDADGTVHILPAGNLAFDGWRNVIVKVPGHIRQHSRLRSGPAKMTFVGFRVTTDPAEYVDDFMVYFDDLKYTTYTLSNIFDGYELQDSDFGDGATEPSTGSSSGDER